MMRTAAVVCVVVGLLFALTLYGWAAGEQCQTATASSSEADIDIGKETAYQTIKTRLEFAEKCGISQEQFVQVMRAKGKLHRIGHDLTQKAEALAIALGSDTIGDDEKKAAVEEYMKLRAETVAQYNAIQDEIIKTAGADTNPLAMGALIILGAVDSGKRVTCAIKSPVAGGAGTDVHGAPGEGGLAASFGFRGPRPAGRRPFPRYRQGYRPPQQ